MKQLFLLFFIFILSIMNTQISYWASFNDYQIKIEKWDTKEDIYRIIREKDKESLKVWNLHTEFLWSAKQEKVCSILDELLNWKRDNSDWLKNFIYWIACYVNEYWTRKSLIRTDYEEDKVFNIELWQKQFNWMVLKKWQEISSNKLLQPLEYSFKEWNVLFYNKETKKVEVKRETWWWICWVTTSLYQNFINDNNIDILERWNHSNWYNSYYWTIKWRDAMIYFWQSDFKFRNNNDSNIYLELWWEKKWNRYEYYTLTKSLYKDDRNIITSKEYRDQKWRICVDTYIWWKNITSCYRNIY